MKHPTILTGDNTYYTDKCIELEKCIKMNSTLQELKIDYEGKNEITSTIISVTSGATRNKTITSLTLDVHHLGDDPPPLPDKQIEQLLKDNSTIQALTLYISDELLLSIPNIVEVNIPLTALELGWRTSKLMTSLLPHIKGLHCLILHEPYPPHLIFLSHPSLHTLTLALDTAESAIELFTILQTNTTLKALSVKIKEERVYTSQSSLSSLVVKRSSKGGNSLSVLSVMLCNSLQDMLTKNETLKYLENNNVIPSSFLPFLTNGLRQNTSLQQLSVSIPLNAEIQTFINVISQKSNLTELELNFKPDQSYSNSMEEKQIMTPLFYEQVLPAVTNMLQSHTTIRLLRIQCAYINKESSQPNWIELVQHLYETIFIHPSLKYIEINTGVITPHLLKDTLEDQKKKLIDKEQPHKPLPIVNISGY